MITPWDKRGWTPTERSKSICEICTVIMPNPQVSWPPELYFLKNSCPQAPVDLATLKLQNKIASKQINYCQRINT